MSKHPLPYKFFIILMGLCVVTIGSQSFAQIKKSKYKRLSDRAVTDFIEDTTAATAIDNVKDNPNDVLFYLNRHIDDGARFKTNINFVAAGGEAPPPQSLLLSKDEYINQVMQAAASVEEYETKIDIDTIGLSKDKKRASVSTVSTETGVMRAPNPDGSVSTFSVQGRSECFQVLRISKESFIQMFSANCETTMEFQPL